MEIEGYEVFVAEGSDDEINESFEKKKGRGRPKKGVNEEPVQKKGKKEVIKSRGRPKKDENSEGSESESEKVVNGDSNEEPVQKKGKKDKNEKQAVKKNWPNNNLTKNAGSITYINYSDESTSDSNSDLSEYERDSDGSSSAGISTDTSDSDKSDFENTFRPSNMGLGKHPRDVETVKERKNAVKKKKEKEPLEKKPKFYELNFTDTSETDTSSEEGASFSEYSDDGEDMKKKKYKFNEQGAYDVEVSKAKKGKSSSSAKYGKRPTQHQRKSRPKKPLLDNSSSDEETDEDDIQPLHNSKTIPGKKRIFIDEEYGSGDNEDGGENSSQVTKGRGRSPKKASPKSSPAKDTGAKKGRGRPKNIIESSDDDEKEEEKIET